MKTKNVTLLELVDTSGLDRSDEVFLDGALFTYICDNFSDSDYSDLIYVKDVCDETHLISRDRFKVFRKTDEITYRDEKLELGSLIFDQLLKISGQV